MEYMIVSGLSAVLVWTFFASLVLLFNRFSPIGSARIKYHLSTATLFALPAGLLLSPFVSFPAALFPDSSGQIGLLTQNFSILMPEILVSSSGVTESAQGAESSSFSALWSWTAVLSALILGAMLAGLIRLSWLWVSLKRELKNASDVSDGQIITLFKELCRDKKVDADVRLMASSVSAIPFASGFTKPIVVMPEKIIHEADFEKLILIFDHELTHIKNGDYAAHFMELVVRHLFWFHPLVHFLYRQAAWYREVCCDNEVLTRYRQSFALYAELLYSYALQTDKQPHFQAAMAGGYKLIGRIRLLQQLHNPKRTKSMTSLKSSLLMAVIFSVMLAGVMACSDLMQNPDADGQALGLDDAIELHGQTITLGDLRKTVQTQHDSVVETLNRMESGEINVPEERLSMIKAHKQELANLLMLIDSGDAGRVATLAAGLLPPQPGTRVSEEESGGDDVFMVVEEMPVMKGGMYSLYENLVFPESARNAGTEGRVIAQFIVDEQGFPTNIDIVRSLTDDTDQAVVDALEKVRFTPGMQRGQPVKVQMTIPVVFRLN
ncbi:MAG: M56 family metallopeptidase [Balneolales bacterium]|nr:M56 family metallopeptidase [Balneolales bacterium]